MHLLWKIPSLPTFFSPRGTSASCCSLRSSVLDAAKRLALPRAFGPIENKGPCKWKILSNSYSILKYQNVVYVHIYNILYIIYYIHICFFTYKYRCMYIYTHESYLMYKECAKCFSKYLVSTYTNYTGTVCSSIGK